jgi:C4-dicarboxylate-specific signal transduction histidine kinase
MVHELVQFVRFDRTLPAASIRVRVEAEPVVLGNKVKLQQVLINLLKNASHAIAGCPDGQIELRLEADAASALIVVEDNGCGMSADLAARIWEPFFTTKGQEGTGVGLDISRSIISRHEGQIDCQTAPGRGATFTIRLPLMAASEEVWAGGLAAAGTN